MKKSEIKLGQSLYWDGREDNVKVLVVDVTLANDMVGIADGGIAHAVHADELSIEPFGNLEPIESVVFVELVEEPISTIPKLDIKYDEDVEACFITINNKTTISIANVSKDVLDAIGISYKNDTDEYNVEIGDALAFYRSSKGLIKLAQQAREEAAKHMSFPFGI